MIDTGSRRRAGLGGVWELAFDPADHGLAEGWAAGNWPRGRAESVRVPSMWNTKWPDADGLGFYRTSFAVPGGWDGCVVELCFEGISYAVQGWVNGRYVGRHEGAYTPFRWDVTAALRADAENELVLRVASLSRSRTVDGMSLIQSPASKQSWYYASGGVWGEVALEVRSRLSFEAVRVTPDLDREMVEVEVVTRNDDDRVLEAGLETEVRAPHGGVVAGERLDVSVPPGQAAFRYETRIRRPQVWSCEAPLLYESRMGLMADGQQSDSQTVTFGMRSFSVREGQFFLNGEPIFLKGVLLQPNYPATDFVPPDPQMMAREISLAKEAGFNLLRAHLRPAPPGYLDLTDRMGMLVYAESPMGWIRDSPRLLDHCQREMRALVERDRNHPSVVIWGVHNENRAASAQTGEALVRHVRALDSTRVIVDNSGGSMAIDQDFGWVDATTVVNDRQVMREPIKDVHLYLGSPIDTGIYQWLRTLGTSEPEVDLADYGLGSSTMLQEWCQGLREYSGKIYVSELGCGGMADLDEVVAGFGDQTHLRDAVELQAFRDSLHAGFAARGLDRVFGTVRDLVRASQQLQANGNVRQIEALLVNRRVSGYGLCQLNDVAWEFHAGILDHWRNPKPAYEALARVNRPHRVVLRSSSTVLVHGQRADVSITVVQHPPLAGVERLVATAYRNGEEFARQEFGVEAVAGISELGSLSFATDTDEADADDADGYEWIVIALLLDGDDAVVAESRERIVSLQAPDWKTAARAVTWIGDPPSGHDDAPGPDGQATGDAVVTPRPGTLTGPEWNTLLDAVDAGGCAVLGPLTPRDESALQTLQQRGLRIKLDLGIGNWMGCYHWMPQSDLFEGLPAGGLADETFVGVLPRYVMAELGGEVLAGSFRNTQTRRAAPAMLWYSDVERVGLGQGSLILCQYELFDHANDSPVAGRMLANLLNLARGA